MIDEKSSDMIISPLSENSINDVTVDNELTEKEVAEQVLPVVIEAKMSNDEAKELESDSELPISIQPIENCSFTNEVVPADVHNELSTINDEAFAQDSSPKVSTSVVLSEKNENISHGDAKSTNSVGENKQPAKAVSAASSLLWKYLPIPNDEPEPHEEYRCMQASFAAGTVAGASVRGKMHKHGGTNRDDWFEVTDFRDWIIVAVSDGAGSKKFSRIGAKISCEAATNYIKEELAKQEDSYSKFLVSLAKPLDDLEFVQACSYLSSVMKKSALHAISKIEEIFEMRKNDPEYEKCVGRELKLDDFAGTFLISMIIPVNINAKKETLILSCQIGDGMIAAIDSEAPFDAASKLLGDPDGGTFSGETCFLLSPGMKDVKHLSSRTRVARGKYNMVLLMSDGVADDYFPNDTEIKRLYLDLLANGIIECPNADMTINKKTVAAIKQLPDAISHPWVNDPNVRVSINYVNKIMDTMNCSLAGIWDKKSVLGYAALDTQGFENAGNQAEKLKIWLDNYVVRGSFDDRTLVIVSLT